MRILRCKTKETLQLQDIVYILQNKEKIEELCECAHLLLRSKETERKDHAVKTLDPIPRTNLTAYDSLRWKLLELWILNACNRD